MSGGDIPDSLKFTLGPPSGIRAYRRRIINPSTLNVYRPGDYVDIYPDTATPGAFLDVRSSYLAATLNIINCRFDVDYTDFGVEGAFGALISEFRCNNQGTTLEEILQYRKAASMMASFEGAYQKQTVLYKSARLRGNFNEEFHRNFIKSPMVDCTGNIMYGPNPYGLGINLQQSSSYSSTVTNFGALGAANNTANLGLNMCIHHSGLSHITQKANTIGATAAGGTFDANITDSVTAMVHTDAMYPPVSTVANPPAMFALAGSKYGNNYPFQQCLTGTTPSWMAAGLANSKLPNLVTTVTPMDFPFLFSPDMVDIRSYETEFGTINKPQIMANLCNVKLFPIGVVATQTPYGSDTNSISKLGTIDALVYSGTQNQTFAQNVANTALKNSPPTPTQVSYRLCYRPYSGIVGRFASKMLATSLMAPMQFNIQFKLAQSHEFFNVSFDPCRRVCGTLRDYIRNTGWGNGGKYQNVASGGYVGIPNAPSIYQYNADNQLAVGYIPGRTIVTNTAANVDALGVAASTCQTIYDTASASGRSIYQGAADLGSTRNSTTSVSLGAFQNVQFTFSPSGGMTHPLPPTPQYMLCTEPWKVKSAVIGNTTDNLYFANETQVLYGTYLPESVPQSKRIWQFPWEGYAPGANLPADRFGPAVQVSSSLPLPAVNGYTPSEPLTYTLTQVQLIGHQVILPDSMAKMVIEAAAAGQFNIQTESIRVYPVPIISGSSTQNISCPFKVNIASAIYFLFQDVRQNSTTEGWYYDSNCGFNPFALVQKNTKGEMVSIEGHASPNCTSVPVQTKIFGCGHTLPVEVTHTTNSTDAFSAQLVIGSDFYPPNPIRNIVELSVELMKTLDGWHLPTYSPEVDGSLLPVIKTNTGNDSSAPNYFAYNCLEPSKFVTAFVPREVLDDQTITGNVDFVPLYASPNRANASYDAGQIFDGTLAGTAVAAIATAANGFRYIAPRGYCIPKMFKTPSSRFVLGFDLQTWHRSDGVISGEYLGAGTINLQLSGAVGFTATNAQYEGVGIIKHQAVLRYTSGGGMIWAY